MEEEPNKTLKANDYEKYNLAGWAAQSTQNNLTQEIKDYTKQLYCRQEIQGLSDYSFFLFEICSEDIFEKLRKIYQNFPTHDRFVMMLELIRIELGEEQLTKIKGEFLRVARQKIEKYQKQVQINELISKLDVQFDPRNKYKKKLIKAMEKYCMTFEIYMTEGKEKALFHISKSRQRTDNKSYRFKKIQKITNDFEMRNELSSSTLKQDLYRKRKQKEMKRKFQRRETKYIWRFGCIQFRKGHSPYQFEIKILVKKITSKMVNQLQNFTKIEQEQLNFERQIEIDMPKENFDSINYSRQSEMIKQEDKGEEYISFLTHFEQNEKLKNQSQKHQCFDRFEEQPKDYLAQLKSPEIQSELEYVSQFIPWIAKEEIKIIIPLKLFTVLAQWIVTWAESENVLVSPIYFRRVDERCQIIAMFIELETFLGKEWPIQKESSFRKYVQYKKKKVQIIVQANQTNGNPSKIIQKKKLLLAKVPFLIQAYSNFIRQKSNCLMALKCFCLSREYFQHSFERLKIVLPEVRIRNFVKRLDQLMSQVEIEQEIQLQINYEQKKDFLKLNIEGGSWANQLISKLFQEEQCSLV